MTIDAHLRTVSTQVKKTVHVATRTGGTLYTARKTESERETPTWQEKIHSRRDLDRWDTQVDADALLDTSTV